MTTRDIKNNIDTVSSLEPALRATGTSNGSGVDLQGYGSAMVVVQFGAYTNGTHTPSLEHSDDNSTFTAAAASDMDGSFTAVSSSANGTTQRVGYRGSKRYIRAVMTVASGATGCYSGALVVRGQATQVPV